MIGYSTVARVVLPKLIERMSEKLKMRHTRLLKCAGKIARTTLSPCECAIADRTLMLRGFTLIKETLSPLSPLLYYLPSGGASLPAIVLVTMTEKTFVQLGVAYDFNSSPLPRF